MTKKDITKQVLLSLAAGALIFPGVFGFVWQFLKFDSGAPDLGGIDIRLLLVFVLMMVVGGKLIKASQNTVPSKLSAMSGEQFEQCVSEILRKRGHSVKLTPRSGDYGVDIIMDNTTAIQCKRYGKNVSLKAVQEVYSGMIHYGLKNAVVVTNSGFTGSAIKLANELGVVLWDGRKLESMM